MTRPDNLTVLFIVLAVCGLILAPLVIIAVTG